MFSLIRHIEYLLTNHDCVVIPGLGAILGVHESAVYDVESGRMMPPCRRFAFNSDLVESDGLLVNSVARSKGIDYRHAISLVETAVEELLTELKNLGEVSLGRIGRLEYKDDDIITFVPFERDLLTPLSDWMPVVKKACLTLPESDTMHDAGTTGRNDRIRRRSGIRRFVRNTIGAAAAIFIGLTVSTPVTIDNTHQASLEVPSIRKASVSVPCKSEKIKDVVIQISDSTDSQEDLSRSTADLTGVHSVESKAVSATAERTTAKAASQLPRFVESDNYIVVVGSLTSTEDADEYVRHLSRLHKNLNFGVARQGKRVRIYAATGSTMDQARQMMKNPTVANSFSDAWIAARN